MRTIFVLFLMAISFEGFSQNKKSDVTGRYVGYFGTSIDIRENSTFKFEWHFDSSASWTKGTWRREKDTIFLNKIIIYDTLILENDSVLLIKSMDEQPDKIYQAYNLTLFPSSGGQDNYPIPVKLILKNGKLFLVQDGRIVKKKLRGFWNKKKVPSWYVKGS